MNIRISMQQLPQKENTHTHTHEIMYCTSDNIQKRIKSPNKITRNQTKIKTFRLEREKKKELSVTSDTGSY